MKCRRSGGLKDGDDVKDFFPKSVFGYRRTPLQSSARHGRYSQTFIIKEATKVLVSFQVAKIVHSVQIIHGVQTVFPR